MWIHKLNRSFTDPNTQRPHAIKGAIEQDLERLEHSGIIEKVSYSDRAAPIVPVPKPDGKDLWQSDGESSRSISHADAEDLFATLARAQA